MCKALLGKQCDCSLENGKPKSHLKITGLDMDMKCVPSRTSDFAKGFAGLLSRNFFQLPRKAYMYIYMYIFVICCTFRGDFSSVC